MLRAEQGFRTLCVVQLASCTGVGGMTHEDGISPPLHTHTQCGSTFTCISCIWGYNLICFREFQESAPHPAHCAQSSPLHTRLAVLATPSRSVAALRVARRTRSRKPRFHKSVYGRLAPISTHLNSTVPLEHTSARSLHEYKPETSCAVGARLAFLQTSSGARDAFSVACAPQQSRVLTWQRTRRR